MKIINDSILKQINTPKVKRKFNHYVKDKETGKYVDDRKKETVSRDYKVFIPDNFDDLLKLPYKNKVLGKYKREVHLLKYVLNRCYISWVRADEDNKEGVGLGYYAMSALVNWDKKSWSGLSKFLVEQGILHCDKVSEYRVKAFTYSLSDKMKEVGFTLSDEKETFVTLAPDNDLDIARVNLTVDAEYVNSFIDYISDYRGWDEKQKEVQRWLLLENFSLDYSVGKTNRIFGRWNNTPRELRGSFKIDDEYCVEPDLSNSQPLLLSVIYNDLPESPSLKAEAEKYKSLVQSGCFYEDIENKTGLNGRSNIKSIYMAWLCGKSPKECSDVKEIISYMDKEFPILLVHVLTLKREGGYNSDGWKELGLRLQRYESDVIVETICKEYDALSTHDGVICRASDGEAIKARIEEVMMEKYNIKAPVKIGDMRSTVISGGLN